MIEENGKGAEAKEEDGEKDFGLREGAAGIKLLHGLKEHVARRRRREQQLKVARMLASMVIGDLRKPSKAKNKIK
jgi:hypothetical protein